MKVVVITSSISRNAGGLLDAVKDLYKEIYKKIDLVIYSYEDQYTKEDLELWGDIKVKLFKKIFFFEYSKKLRDSLLSENADILHIHGIWRYPQAVVIPWKRKTGGKVIISPHGMLDPYIIKQQGKIKQYIGQLLFVKNSFELTDVFHSLSNTESLDIRSYKINKPIVQIPNGINLCGENTSSSQNSPIKNLLFLARLHPKKGVDLLINSFCQLLEEHIHLKTKWELHIVGWGDEHYINSLKEISKSYATENITFHGGLFGAEKEKVYKKANAYILPSHGEGLPMTILEAWCYKLPVLMTEKCNIPEGFISGAAYKIDANIEKLKAQLNDFFTLPESELQAMGQRGYDLVSKDFTWKKSGEKMLMLYEAIMEGNLNQLEYVHTK